jgi:hypothetical protein
LKYEKQAEKTILLFASYKTDYCLNIRQTQGDRHFPEIRYLVYAYAGHFEPNR